MEVHHRLLMLNNNPFFNAFKDELDKAQARYQIKKLGKIGVKEQLSIEFIVSEQDELFSFSQSLIPKYKIFDQVSVHFDKHDYERSEWFYIFAGEYQYPMGENEDSDYLEVTYDLSEYCDKCGIEKIQNNPFRLKSDFKQRTNQFLGLHNEFGKIFVREHAKNILTQNGIIGVEFTHPVRASNKQPIETVYQMKIGTVLEPGLLQAWHNGGKGYAVCPFCNSRKSQYPNRDVIRLNKSIISANMPDIVQSNEYFGSGLLSNRLTLVSKRFYSLVQQNKLKGLSFTPIVLE